MCEPMTILGAALSAAGTAVSAASQQAFANAQQRAQREAYEISRRAREAELVRQKQLEEENTSNWNTARQKLDVESQTSRREDAATQFMQRFEDARAGSLSGEGQYLSGQQFATPELRAEVARLGAQGADEARRRVQALAALQAYGTVETQNNQTISNLSNALATVNGIRRGSLGVSQQEQNISPAQVSPGTGGMLGGILSGFGGLALRSGGSGGSGGTQGYYGETGARRGDHG